MSNEPPIADAIEPDARPLREVTQTVPAAGVADLELRGHREKTGVTVIPIRAPETPEDVELHISVGPHNVHFSMTEEDALALEDAIHQALQVEPFDN
jgi:hypothetical protein